MPRDGAIIFADLARRLPVLKLSCTKCGREGRYLVFRLIKARGPDAKVIDWLDELTATARKVCAQYERSMRAQCPDLARVL